MCIRDSVIAVGDGVHNDPESVNVVQLVNGLALGEHFPVDGIDVLDPVSYTHLPVPGDPIVGFITKGFGVSIHRADCPNAQNREDPRQAARWVRVR